MKTKDIVGYIVGGILALGFIFVVMFAMRFFSNATTPAHVINPAPHIECVKIVTGDGAAIDCNWSL